MGVGVCYISPLGPVSCGCGWLSAPGADRSCDGAFSTGSLVLGLMYIRVCACQAATSGLEILQYNAEVSKSVVRRVST